MFFLSTNDDWFLVIFVSFELINCLKVLFFWIDDCWLLIISDEFHRLFDEWKWFFRCWDFFATLVCIFILSYCCCCKSWCLLRFKFWTLTFVALFSFYSFVFSFRCLLAKDWNDTNWLCQPVVLKWCYVFLSMARMNNWLLIFVFVVAICLLSLYNCNFDHWLLTFDFWLFDCVILITCCCCCCCCSVCLF